jgi:hypothetical protein
MKRLKSKHANAALGALTAMFMLACGGGPITIHGRLVDNTSAPLHRVEVASEPDTQLALTNERGQFALTQRVNDGSPIPPGTYTLTFVKDGFKDLVREIVATGGRVDLAEVMMTPLTAEVGPASPEPTKQVKPTSDTTSTPVKGT